MSQSIIVPTPPAIARPDRHPIPSSLMAQLADIPEEEMHMRQRLAPMLFDDTDKEAAEAERKSVVAQAQRSKAAVKKQTTGLTPDGLPVHSFRSLLADLATLARNTITTAIAPLYPLTMLTRPTSIQQKAFELLAVRL